MGFVNDPLGNVFNGAVIGLERMNNGSWIDRGPGAAAPEPITVTIYPTSDEEGGWVVDPLYSKVDDASDADYISCTQGLGETDKCRLHFGNITAYHGATAITLNYSQYAAAPSTTGYQVEMFKDTSFGIPIFLIESPTDLTPDTFTPESHVFSAGDLSAFNTATTVSFDLTATDFGATNRCGFFSLTITYIPA